MPVGPLDDVVEAAKGSPSRRGFLKLLAGVGFAGSVAAMLAPEDFLGGGRDEVPLVYGVARTPGDGAVEPKTTHVPRDWYNELERAFEKQRLVLESDIPGLAGVFVNPGDYTDADWSLSVDVTTEDAESALEELADDLRYTTNYVESLTPFREYRADVSDPHLADVRSRRRVPGGGMCSTGEYKGTLAPAMYDPETGQRFFATANHVYGDEGRSRTKHRGEPLFLSGEDSESLVGRVRRGYPADDIVRVDPANGFEPISRIEGAEPSTVSGQFTKHGLADLAARGEPLEKMGAHTWHTSGEIKGVNGVTCYYGPCKRGQVKWGGQQTILEGDSGSVSYHPDVNDPDDSVLVAGFNNAHAWWPVGDFSWGTAAHHVRANHGYHF